MNECTEQENGKATLRTNERMVERQVNDSELIVFMVPFRLSGNPIENVMGAK